MKRIRIMGLCLTVMFILGAIASASAMAAPEFEVCEKGGTEKWENHLCVGNKGTGEWSFLKISKEYEVEGTSGVTLLKSKVGTEEIIIECKKDKFKGTIGPGGKSTGKVTYEECKVVKPANCTVTIPTFEVTDQLVTGPEEEFKPTKAEETFVEIKVEGSLCALKGTYKVKGTQTCKLPSAETGKVEHEIVCEASGSKLTLGKEKAEFTGTEKVHLVNGWAWRSK